LILTLYLIPTFFSNLKKWIQKISRSKINQSNSSKFKNQRNGRYCQHHRKTILQTSLSSTKGRDKVTKLPTIGNKDRIPVI
jgi:hypothetical protein